MSTTKKVIDPFKIIDAGSMAGNISSTATNVRNMDMVTFFVEWTGNDPIGYLSFQYVEKESINPALETWKTIYLGPGVGNLIPINLDSGSHTVLFTMVPFVKIRAIYTASSGTGNLTVTITGKEG
jgi:hypothetical protein